MNTLPAKLSAVAAAFATNGLIMTGVIYLFALQTDPHISVISLARRLVAHQWLI